MARHDVAWHDRSDGILRNPKSSKQRQNVPMTPVRAGRGMARHGMTRTEIRGIQGIREAQKTDKTSQLRRSEQGAGRSQGMAWRGMVWRGMARRSTAWRKTAWRTPHVAQHWPNAAQSVAQTRRRRGSQATAHGNILSEVAEPMVRD